MPVYSDEIVAPTSTEVQKSNEQTVAQEFSNTLSILNNPSVYTNQKKKKGGLKKNDRSVQIRFGEFNVRSNNIRN